MGWFATRLVEIVAAALLALVVAAPALAEIGCAADAAAHFAEVPDADAEPDPDGGEPERDGHCAFGHGHGDLTGGHAGPRTVAGKAAFAPPAPAGFVSARPPGPDRPPRT